MKDKIHSISRVIDTDSETLFKIVSGFNLYKNWNTVIPNAKGELVVGTKLQLTMIINGKNKPFNPKVISVVPNKSFILSKTLFSKNILELTHLFEFKPLTDHKTEFIQTWKGQGILTVMLWEKIKNGFSSFEVFNNDIVKYISEQEK
ncbi:hypothetical protein [Parapedobacter sp. 2B3]|uniref:hypothetical protein n=1 Tax=Parapedobacter sp. 2B3 TaxID=3342381 RepID=UPI0035B593FF